MASIAFNEAKRLMLADLIAQNVVKATLCMTNTTCPTEQDTNTVSAITTLDEMDGSGFTWGHGNSGRKTVSLAATADDTANQGEAKVSGNAITWSSLGAGTRSVDGVLFLVEGSADDTTAVPLFYFEFSSPKPATGDDFTVNFDGADGAFFVADV